MRHPKYDRCDWCGRNKHKVAVRLSNGYVHGYCPSCVKRLPTLMSGGRTVLYDRRRTKLPRAD